MNVEKTNPATMLLIPNGFLRKFDKALKLCVL